MYESSNCYGMLISMLTERVNKVLCKSNGRRCSDRKFTLN